jgi:hypothetical protein
MVSLGAQEGKDSEDAAVVSGYVAESELEEDLAAVASTVLGPRRSLVQIG